MPPSLPSPARSARTTARPSRPSTRRQTAGGRRRRANRGNRPSPTRSTATPLTTTGPKPSPRRRWRPPTRRSARRSDLTVDQRDGNGDWGGRVQSLTIDGSARQRDRQRQRFPRRHGVAQHLVDSRCRSRRPRRATCIRSPRRAFSTPANPATATSAIRTAARSGRAKAACSRSPATTACRPTPSASCSTSPSTDTTSSSYLTVWPRPYSRPTTSNLNWDRAGQTVANLVYTGLGPDGTVLIYNNAGNASVDRRRVRLRRAGDGQRWLGLRAGHAESHLRQPGRLAETPTPKKLAAGESRSVAVAGTPGVRPDAQAALVNLTGTGPTAESYLTLWPTGTAQPNTSNLNLLPGETRANAALGLLGGGAVSLYNNLGDTDAILDVMGQYVPADGRHGRVRQHPAGPLARYADVARRASDVAMPPVKRTACKCWVAAACRRPASRPWC